MKYYGLHFVGDDLTPIQVRFGLNDQQCWMRSCPNGEWTAWRRLDADRNADGTLDETVSNAKTADTAMKAKRLEKTVTISVSGDMTGSVSFDGSQEAVSLSLSAVNQEDYSGPIDDLKKRVAALEADVATLQEWVMG